jgi:hypothetical protein
VALPSELDISESEDLTKERLDKAFEYIVSRLRALESNTLLLDSVINDVQSLGLTRLNEVLLPVFNAVNEIEAALEAIEAEWVDQDFPGQLSSAAAATVIEEFEDYRHRYLGASATEPTVDDAGNAVEQGALYYDTVGQRMRVLGAAGWKDAGSVVEGVMQAYSLTATASQTTFTIPGGYEEGQIIVALNGTLLAPEDYTATNGATVVFPSGLSVGDSVSGFKFGAITLSNVYDKRAADAERFFWSKR